MRVDADRGWQAPTLAGDGSAISSPVTPAQRRDGHDPQAAAAAMSLTPSTMLPLGTPLPLALMESALEPVVGGPLRGEELRARPVLVLFICPHCPFVKHIEPELGRLERDFAERVAMLAICSNSVHTHPQDGPAGMAAQAERQG